LNFNLKTRFFTVKASLKIPSEDFKVQTTFSLLAIFPLPDASPQEEKEKGS